MKKIYIYLIYFAVFFYLGFSISEIENYPYSRIGTTILTDSTGYTTTNHSLKVNGYMNARDSLYSPINKGSDFFVTTTNGGIYWRVYGSSITEGIDQLQMNSSSFQVNTKLFNNIVTIDSATGLNTTKLTASSTATFNGNVVTSGYVDEGNTGWFGKRYLFKGKIGGAGTGYVNIVHGLDWTRIINYDCVVRNDTTNGGVPVAGQPKFVKPGSYFGSLTCYSKIDSLYCQLSVGNGANNNLLNDSVFFWVYYRP